MSAWLLEAHGWPEPEEQATARGACVSAYGDGILGSLSCERAIRIISINAMERSWVNARSHGTQQISSEYRNAKDRAREHSSRNTVVPTS